MRFLLRRFPATVLKSHLKFSVMRFGSGLKTRKIVATKASVNETFEFNKPIFAQGGTSARMKMKQNKKGSLIIKIFQDNNNDSTISRKELTYKGISQANPSDDGILNFNGKIHLKKEMHMCNWLAQTKRPAEVCTTEYIPTTFECKLITDTGETFRFNALGDFEGNPIKIYPNDSLINT